MNFFQDMIFVNKTTIKNTIGSFKNNWAIVFTGVIYITINILLLLLLSTFFQGILYIFAGFIMALVSASLVSNYLYLLFNVINYNQISLEDFKEGFKAFLWKVYGVLFIAWIGQYLLNIILNLINLNWVNLSSIITLLIFIALNPLPETIYLKSYTPFESITYAFAFMKENWINWLLPNIVFYILIYLFTNKIFTNIFTTHLNFVFDFSPRGIVLYLLGQLLFSIMMIYRGHLFKLLSTSSRRKRMYMNDFRR